MSVLRGEQPLAPRCEHGIAINDCPYCEFAALDRDTPDRAPGKRRNRLRAMVKRIRNEGEPADPQHPESVAPTAEHAGE